MAKNGQKWSKMAKNGLFGGSLGKPPPPPLFAVQILLENPGFRQKGHFPGFLESGGGRKRVVFGVLVKNWHFGGQIWGPKSGQELSKNGQFWGFLGGQKRAFLGVFFTLSGGFLGGLKMGFLPFLGIF